MAISASAKRLGGVICLTLALAACGNESVGGGESAAVTIHNKLGDARVDADSNGVR